MSRVTGGSGDGGGRSTARHHPGLDGGHVAGAARARALVAILCIVLYVVADLGIRLIAPRADVLVPWYPAAGLGLAFLIVAGPRTGFLVLVVARAVAGFALATTRYRAPAWGVVLDAVIVTGIYAIAAHVVRRHVVPDDRGWRVREATWLAGSALLASAAAAAVGSLAVHLWRDLSGIALLRHALVFWAGDATGCLVLAPLLLFFGLPRLERWHHPAPLDAIDTGELSTEGATGRDRGTGSTTEHVLQALSVVAAIALSVLLASLGEVAGAFLCFAPLAWVALRVGANGSAIVMLTYALASAAIAWWLDLPPTTLLPMQLLLLTLACVGLFLAAARTAAMEGEAQYWHLLAAASEGVWRVDLQGRTLYVNARMASMLGLEPEQMAGRVATEFVAARGDDGGGEVQYEGDDDGRPLLATGRETTRELQLRRADGTTIDALVHASPLRAAASGEAMGALLLVSDVTAQRQAERQQQQRSRFEELGRLAGGVAHDFNNLLTIITSYAQVARLAVGGGVIGAAGGAPLAPAAGLRLTADAQAELLGDIGEIEYAATRGADLTRRLLAFSRHQTVEPVPIDLNAAVRACERLIRPLLVGDVALVQRLGDDVPVISADASQIEQLLVNLAVNARDAMRSARPGAAAATESTLTIATRGVRLAAGEIEELAAGTYAVLEVRDTGTGMDEATRARLFEPFFTTKDPGQGTGLGLAVVYGIVSQSAGTIRVASTPGQGSTFTVYWPAIAQAPAERSSGSHAAVRRRDAAVPGESPAADAEAGGEWVLVVDDEEAVRGAVVRILARAGYRVTQAENGAEALERIAAMEGLTACDGDADAGSSRLALVVSDVMMPVLGGRELALSLAASRPSLPVLLMSGYHEGGADLRAGLPNVPLPVLAKPFSVPELLAAVERVLATTTVRDATTR